MFANVAWRLYIRTHSSTVTYMETTPPHLTVAEFAARMSMEQHMVRRRIRLAQKNPDNPRGIRAVDIGREYRIPETELTRYVRENAA